MEGCCDICGDIGHADSLLTCAQCKRSREHVYCMRVLLEEPINNWCCEECEFSSEQRAQASCTKGELPGVSKLFYPEELHNGAELRAESSNLPNEARKGSAHCGRRVVTGKTKYISVNEAIQLSSRDNKSKAPPKLTCHSKAPRPNIGVNISERTPIRPPSTPPSFSFQQELCSGSLQQLKSQKLGSAVISKEQPQQSKQLTEEQRPVSSRKPFHDPKNKHMLKEQPANEQLHYVKLRSSMRQPLSTSPPKASLVTFSGGHGRSTIELGNRNVENVSTSSLPGVDKCSRTPALDALWKGRFSIHDHRRCGELNQQFQAHPPSRVRRKICEFLKQMPEVLHFQLVPFQKFWINYFQEYVPDERDIGLYFFPNNGERSEDYIFLVEFIGQKNLALRKQIADVELLVFTSKLLSVNCRLWDGNYFLWGVFHHMKQDVTACPNNKELQLSVLSPRH